MYIESGEIKYHHIMGLLDFHCTYKNIFAVHLKPSCFLQSADAKPMENDLTHAMHCLFALSLSIFILQISMPDINFAHVNTT